MKNVVMARAEFFTGTYQCEHKFISKQAKKAFLGGKFKSFALKLLFTM